MSLLSLNFESTRKEFNLGFNFLTIRIGSKKEHLYKKKLKSNLKKPLNRFFKL